MFKKFPQREEGQGLVEYALILVLVAIVVIAILIQLGPAISQVFLKVTTVLKGENMGVIVNHSPQIQNIGGPVYRLTVSVSVSQATDIQLKTGSLSSTVTCNSSCSPFVQGNIPSSGQYTLTATAGGQISGSY